MGRREKEKWVKLKDSRIKPIYYISSWGRIKNKNDKFIKFDVDKDGYFKVTLQGYLVKQRRSVHRLVAFHFIKNSDKTKTQVNHKDFNKQNNYYKNLEWCTNKYNIEHSVKHHRQDFLTCQEHGMATMTDELVKKICSMFEKGLSTKDVLNSLGYYKKDNPKEYEKMRGRIKHIKSHKTWKPISDQYNF